MTSHQRDNMDALDDIPNRPDRDTRKQQLDANIKQVTVRHLADALSKIIARIEPEDRDDPIIETKKILCEAVGELTTIANKYTRDPLAAPVPVMIRRP